MKEDKFQVSGMTCAACQSNVTKTVKKLPGVNHVEVNLLSGQMVVGYEEEQLSVDQIVQAVEQIGYGATASQTAQKERKSEWDQRKKQVEQDQKKMKMRLYTSLILLVPLMYIAMGEMIGLPTLPILSGMENVLISSLTQLLLTIVILFINRHFYESGFKALIHRVPNMDSLVAIGSGSALLYGIVAIYMMAYGFGHQNMELVHQYGHSLYFESAAMIVTLVTVGKYMEAKSKAKTSDAMERLIQLAPKMASVIRDGKEIRILAEDVLVNDLIMIRPGEKIPVDGVIVEGFGVLDQSAITGESVPVDKTVGDTVISATTNVNGSFQFRASKVGNDTTLAQMIRLVDEASNTKAPIARVADRVSGIFVPVVIGIAIVTAMIWLILGKEVEFALTNAIAVLVISCPCALGLATPVAIMVATGKAAEFGILIKSAEALEQLHSIDTIVLDKTGTITTGKPQVTELVSEQLSSQEFLRLLASLEYGSEHPLACAIVDHAKQQDLSLLEVQEFQVVMGKGVKGKIDGKMYAAGNLTFIQECGWLQEKDKVTTKLETYARAGKIPLLFYQEEKFLGIVVLMDTIKESSKEAITRFHQMGLQVVMLTGDHHLTAQMIQKELGIEQVIAEVLPTQKDAEIQRLQQSGHRVLMVGDGINDAPALVRADVGMAIGAGTDIAMESADIILMKSSLYDVVTAIHLSRKTMNNIYMNLFWAFFYNILGIPVAAGVFYPIWNLRLNPMIASAAMSVSSVSVVLNALRLRLVKEQRPMIEEKQKGNKMMKKTITVEGMMCEHCKMHVEKALSKVDGVETVSVDLKAKTATVILQRDVDDAILKDAVVEAGYEVTEIVKGE
ncbi:MAG: heavy metal translocating P-type ATPase [Erysipelotrichaceae bacterium]|nr:heavy metal translocating P-type ATPase [Erysipelotrichaceae bacterium]